jgi:hypothetical protein
MKENPGGELWEATRQQQYVQSRDKGTWIQESGTRDSGRSWRDSTISALNRVLDGSSEDRIVI